MTTINLRKFFTGTRWTSTSRSATKWRRSLWPTSGSSSTAGGRPSAIYDGPMPPELEGLPIIALNEREPRVEREAAHEL